MRFATGMASCIFKYKVVEEFWIQFRWAICFYKNMHLVLQVIIPRFMHVQCCRMIPGSAALQDCVPWAGFGAAERLWARPVPGHGSGDSDSGIAQHYCVSNQQLEMEGAVTQAGACSEWCQRLYNSQHRCSNGFCAWCTGERYRCNAKLCAIQNPWKLLMSLACGLCTCVNLAISICQPAPIHAGNKKKRQKTPLCCASSWAACRRLLLFSVCQVAEPIAFPPGLIQIASPAPFTLNQCLVE